MRELVIVNRIGVVESATPYYDPMSGLVRVNVSNASLPLRRAVRRASKAKRVIKLAFASSSAD